MSATQHSLSLSLLASSALFPVTAMFSGLSYTHYMPPSYIFNSFFQNGFCHTPCKYLHLTSTEDPIYASDWKYLYACFKESKTAQQVCQIYNPLRQRTWPDPKLLWEKLQQYGKPETNFCICEREWCWCLSKEHSRKAEYLQYSKSEFDF